jgi:hypothetical protein
VFDVLDVLEVFVELEVPDAFEVPDELAEPCVEPPVEAELPEEFEREEPTFEETLATHPQVTVPIANTSKLMTRRSNMDTLG